MSVVYVAVGTAAYEVVSSQQQADAIEANGEKKAHIEELNAQFAEKDAYEAEKFGFTEAGRYQSLVDQTVGDQKVAYASQDVAIGYGTAQTLQDESRFTGMLNMIDIRYQARQKAKGFSTEARNDRLNAGYSRDQASMTAEGVRNQGYIGAATVGISSYKKG